MAVVQNEFAPSNFDGQELKRQTTKHFDLLEINNGSVFCVCLLSGFIQSFSKFIHEVNPEVVFLEASGLSDPISIGEVFNSKELQESVFLAGSVCVVDASGFLKFEKFQQRMVHQVQIANQVIINKIDLVDNCEQVLQKIHQINPQSKKYTSNYCEINMEELLAITNPMNTSQPAYNISAEDIGRPDIKSAVFKTTKAIKEENVNRFLQAIMPQMIRLKGYILLDSGRSLAVQIVNNRLQSDHIDKSIRQTEIIAMGISMSVSDIKTAYLQNI